MMTSFVRLLTMKVARALRVGMMVSVKKTMSTKATILGNAPLSVSKKTFFLMTNVELSNLILSTPGTAATAHWTENIS